MMKPQKNIKQSNIIWRSWRPRLFFLLFFFEKDILLKLIYCIDDQQSECHGFGVNTILNMQLQSTKNKNCLILRRFAVVPLQNRARIQGHPVYHMQDGVILSITNLQVLSGSFFIFKIGQFKVPKQQVPLIFFFSKIASSRY